VQYDEAGEHVYFANPALDLWLYHDALDALPVNSRCTAYYLPTSEQVLSFEPLAS
jgi:hypothetical protein